MFLLILLWLFMVMFNQKHKQLHINNNNAYNQIAVLLNILACTICVSRGRLQILCLYCVTSHMAESRGERWTRLTHGHKQDNSPAFLLEGGTLLRPFSGRSLGNRCFKPCWWQLHPLLLKVFAEYCQRLVQPIYWLQLSFILMLHVFSGKYVALSKRVTCCFNVNHNKPVLFL